jgi:hypothetical protein
MSCKWRYGDGTTCGTVNGKKLKCEEHRTLRCSECDSPAWRECAHPECEAVICRSPACMKAHLDSAHEGKDHLLKTEAPERRAEIIHEADPCPVCAEEPHDRLLITWGNAGGHSRLQISCAKCGTHGPVSKTISLAVTAWNKMPRGRPAAYESIRRRGLKLIDQMLTDIETAMYNGEPVSAEDGKAVAAMLEAATMAVDTWEL